MKINIPEKARIIILEGVAGSGKDTLQKLLKEKFKNKTVYDYSEGELLFTWKLARVKNIAKLKKLPIHILLLQLTAEEIDIRSSHTERPKFWKKYQKFMIKKDGFTNRIERYLNEQKLMLEEAKKDRLPFSIIHLDL